MTAKVELAEGQEFIEGRSEEKARELLKAAKGRESEVLTTSFGYIVPKGLLTAEVKEDVKEIEERQAREAAEKAAAEQAELEKLKPFDPTEASVPEVRDYLSGADEDERKRVLAEEKAGKNRVSIVGSDEEGAK